MQMSVDRSQFPAAGGDTTVNISTLSECEWDLTKNASWITFLDPPHGIGKGAVRIRIQPNRDSVTRVAEFRSTQATPANNGSVARASVTQSAQQAG